MRRKSIPFLLLLLLFLTGCWDRTEIEEVSFVLAVALDPVEDEDELAKQYRQETGKPSPKKMFQLTNQVVIPSKISTEGGATGSPFFNIRSAGMTNFKINRNFATRRSRAMNYEHLKVIIINETLVREGIIRKLIDFYVRDHQMRTDTLIFVSKGKGSEILAEKLPLEHMTAISIDMISENAERSHQMAPPKQIGELSKDVLSGQSYIVPRITKLEGGEFKLAGAAVFQGQENKMVGWLGEYDVEGYTWVIDEKKNQIVEAFFGPEQQPFVFEIDAAHTKTRYERKDGKNTFHIEIRTEGFFVDNWIEQINLDSQETISQLEQAVEKEINYQVNKVIRKMQEEFHTDIFQFHQKVKQADYAYWQEIKKNWDGADGLFSEADIHVETMVKMRHHMTIEQLEEE